MKIQEEESSTKEHEGTQKRRYLNSLLSLIFVIVRVFSWINLFLLNKSLIFFAACGRLCSIELILF